MLYTGLKATSDSNYANISVAFKDSIINASIVSLITINKIDVGFQVDIRTAMNDPFKTLLNRTLDICAFFKNPLMDPLTAIFFNAIPPNNANNHIFKSCPIKAVLIVLFFLLNFCLIHCLLLPHNRIIITSETINMMLRNCRQCCQIYHIN